MKEQRQVFVARRKQGDYAIRKAGSERASAILPTQAKAIERARQMNPNAGIYAERIRQIPGTDKWRKVGLRISEFVI